MPKSYHKKSIKVLGILFTLVTGGYKTTVSGQGVDSTFAAPPTIVCPGTALTFHCYVLDPNGYGDTYWKLEKTDADLEEFEDDTCVLAHFITNDQSHCASNLLHARLGQRIGDYFQTTLSGVSSQELDGISVKCHGPTTDTLVGNTTLDIAEPLSAPLITVNEDYALTRVNASYFNVSLKWSEPGGSLIFVSRYILTVLPAMGPCGTTCTLTPDVIEFQQRIINLTLRQKQMYAVTIRADSCNNTQSGVQSEPFLIELQVPNTVVEYCRTFPVYFQRTNELAAIEISWTHRTMNAYSWTGEWYEISIISDDGKSVKRIANLSNCEYADGGGTYVCSYYFVETHDLTSATSYSVSVAVGNEIGVGELQNCTSLHQIVLSNQFISVDIFEQGSVVFLQFRIICVHKQNTTDFSISVDYGLNDSQLIFNANTSRTNDSLKEKVLSLRLQHTEEGAVTYHFKSTVKYGGERNVLALVGSFELACDEKELGNATVQGDNRCEGTEGALVIANGIVCYSGRQVGSWAYHNCDPGYKIDPGVSTNRPTRCLAGGKWSRSDLACIRDHESASPQDCLNEDFLQLSKEKAGLYTGVIATVSFMSGVTVMLLLLITCCILRRKKNSPTGQAEQSCTHTVQDINSNPGEQDPEYELIDGTVVKERILVHTNQAYETIHH